MNLLLDKLPNTFEDLKINTDFRVCILFELLMQDNEISKEEKIITAFNLFFENDSNNLEKVFNKQEKALDAILWFYRCGKQEKKTSLKKENEANEIKKQIYSYEFDDEYIYSAFLQQYKIDLNSIKYLHWWKFKALMENLSEETQFVKIMGYRSIDLSKIKDKEEKARYKKLKKLYALPDMRTTEQKEADFGRAFW